MLTAATILAAVSGEWKLSYNLEVIVNFIKTLVAGAALVAFAGTASAASELSIVGGTAGQIGDFGAAGDDNHEADNAVIIGMYGDGTVLDGVFGANLFLEQTANVTYEYLGFEAGWTNSLTVGDESFVNRPWADATRVGETITTTMSGGNMLDFLFSSVDFDGVTREVANGANNVADVPRLADFFVTELSDGSFLVAFDDGGASPDDDNHDDLVIRITAVPEPATLVLFGLGLAGLGAARRRSA